MFLLFACVEVPKDASAPDAHDTAAPDTADTDTDTADTAADDTSTTDDTGDTAHDGARRDLQAIADVTLEGSTGGALLGGGRLVVSTMWGRDDDNSWIGRAWVVDDVTLPLDFFSAPGQQILVDTLGDLDGDGFAEWSGYDRDGAYVFSGATTALLDATTARVVGIAPLGAPDLDGDGADDLLDVTEAGLGVWSGTVTGTDPAPAALLPDIAPHPPRAAGMDLDGDGFGDLLYAPDPYTHPVAVRWLPGPLAGTYANEDGAVLFEEASDRALLALLGDADLDGDGRDDVVATWAGPYPSGRVTVHDADGIELAGLSSGYYPLVDPHARGDLDGDGDDDVLVHGDHGGTGGAWILRGPVGGTTDLAELDCLVSDTWSARVYDVDGDGTDDALVGDYYSVDPLGHALAIVLGPL